MKIHNILVAGNYEEQVQEQLPDKISQSFRFMQIDEITEEDLSWADAYVGFKPCPGFNFADIKWVHSFNAGVNNYLEIDGWKKHDILLTRTVCSFGQRISEYCLSYVLRDLQYHHYFEGKQTEKKWSPKTPQMVKDQTIVIFGTGEIGQEVAKVFSSFGATVYGISQSGKQKEYFQKVTETSSANTLVAQADWIISTLPLTNETSKLFDRAFFSNLNGVAFINVGRGLTVDEQALIEALKSRKVRYAVLDVLETEPLPRTSDLWQRDDTVITPHISAVTELNEAIACFLDTLKRIENNEVLPNKVNFWKGY
ncbi:D-2-hydroxyacid dehydrogenase [Alkalihalobacillus sp. TS-13]|uniref:D-2-hydroxyacid dehydrogenase n=1 Tax=Alkalihalobacillus sp. TS-13 TaxID=2842455 RepID=UPI001C888BAA|nr:D-2-hydroxyacid dehydrogenase [Alkalihalobacillus sp. TS-13]